MHHHMRIRGVQGGTLQRPKRAEAEAIAKPCLDVMTLRFKNHSEGLVAQWIRHRPTEPGIAGSSPAKVIVYCMCMSVTV